MATSIDVHFGGPGDVLTCISLGAVKGVHLQRVRFAPGKGLLQPVAIGATAEATKPSKPLVEGVAVGATRRACRPERAVNAEQASKRVTRKPTRLFKGKAAVAGRERGHVQRTTRNKAVHCGTPQGAPVSSPLANLFLHYAFDLWMQRNFPRIRFERYADDAIVHCRSERQACAVLEAIRGRFAQ